MAQEESIKKSRGQSTKLHEGNQQTMGKGSQEGRRTWRGWLIVQKLATEL